MYMYNSEKAYMAATQWGPLQTSHLHNKAIVLRSPQKRTMCTKKCDHSRVYLRQASCQ